ncbi:MAG: 2-oxoacid:acceptor oxidoreductase subunit alpha [Acidobacteriaceae bacterium]|nr:2-oxoacid:acceptor oxidoreductase subunit alpha [Acidobacteriaceae bacterium]MBV9781893.1 2-oxoacid:acceptor oxidoreductase subunit alpha [Acidobacteriaceae bacterium]
MHDQLHSRVNDFAIKLANVNGTGSASANGLLMQAIFRMGIPVSGKNLFPSNIQGLPTWYEIRVNKDGHTARALDYDLMVAMNAQTYARDIGEVRSGGYVLYDSSWPLDRALYREDVNFLPVPLAQMCNEHFKDPRERTLMKNIAYAGSLVATLDIDMPLVEQLLDERFAGKKALRESNRRALRLGYDYAKQQFECPLNFHLEKMDANGDKILIDGNTATALGCIYAGATVAAWYPITPATSVMDAFKQFCEKYRRDPETAENNYVILQAEDELAAIGMVIGASWNGARAFTSTAGPGISLMNELLGLAYYTEIPAVVIDVQRVGPSTGMPTRTQQADLIECAYASHGDTKHILLFPANPAECFEFAIRSFDLAERFQTPVIMLSDLDIGMNDWVVPGLAWDDSYRPDRGRVLGPTELEQLTRYNRYSGEDEDHVAPRTLPGVDPRGAYVARGSGHNKFGGYTETPSEYQEVMDRLARKQKAAANFVPLPEIDRRSEARFGVITIGGCEPAVLEALDLLADRDIPADYMRVRGFPFHKSVEAFLYEHEFCFVVEQNRDAQLRSLLILETCVPKDRVRSVLVYGGFPLSARHVVDGIMHQLEK